MALRDQLVYEPVELSFGTSGLRGLVVDMTDLECYINTLGFIRFLQAHDELTETETIYIAGDLRGSTPRISSAVYRAISDAGLQAENCGLIPTPAVAYYALQHQAPCIMVTGSHIPADRNGIKFYKRAGEILKADEPAIKDCVAEVRASIYAQGASTSQFDQKGYLEQPPALPAVVDDAARMYQDRYTDVFGSDALRGLQLVFYQHSAVGRDLLVNLLESLGATVQPVGRSEVFVPIDNENVTAADQAYFTQLAQDNPGNFAVVSTDGDSDRPFVVDERGTFHRGDVLGAVVATWLQSDAAAYPISSSDAVDDYLELQGIPSQHTRIGSPYVISAMQVAQTAGSQRTVGWEVNGGFMIGNNFTVDGQLLKALPTRDAILPIIIALLAAKTSNTSISQLFTQLPTRYTRAGLIDEFPVAVSRAILKRFSLDGQETQHELEMYFGANDGFAKITAINSLDGIRISFANGDIAHLRPSGNAPQLRVYSVSDTQERADEIVTLALAEPNGIFRKIQHAIEAKTE